MKVLETKRRHLLGVFENFSFLPLMESGISFYPENPIRFGPRAPPRAGRGIDFSNVVRVGGIEPPASKLSV